MITAIERITREYFGTYADILFENAAVLPVNGKLPVTTWGDGVDPSTYLNLGGWKGLAILTGSRSGITAYDVDDPNLDPPVPYNVLSKRGGHIYVPWRGERSTIGRVPKIDVKGEGGYVVFYGPEKTFKTPVLADPSFLYDWYESLYQEELLSYTHNASSPVIQPSDVDTDIDNKDTGPDAYNYLDDVAHHGLRVDVDEWLRRALIAVSTRKEGKRGWTLFRLALEAARLGVDPACFLVPAITTGLSEKEARGHIDRAVVAATLDPRPQTTVLHQVLRWEAHFPSLPAVEPVITLLKIEAVRLNTLEPQINQTVHGEMIGMDQQLLGYHLQKLEKPRKAVVKIPAKGCQSNGRRWPNNYRLTIAGKPLWEADINKDGQIPSGREPVLTFPASPTSPLVFC
jgi:hypothetical protein